MARRRLDSSPNSPAARFGGMQHQRRGLDRHRASLPADDNLGEWARAMSLTDIDHDNVLEPEQRAHQLQAKTKSLTPSPSGGRRFQRLAFDASVFNLTHTSPEVFAENITDIDLPMFQAITRDELLACKWTSKAKNHVSPKIVAFTQQFNQISFWVMKEIIGRATMKYRVEALTYFIRLAKKLLHLNNINSLVAVVSALQSAPVYRLKRTWSDVCKKERAVYHSLVTLLSEEENRKNLRAHMETMKCPCIPYLGIFLTDLTYLSVVASKAKSDAAVEEVRSKMLNISNQIARWQMSIYSGFKEVRHVQEYLQSVQYLHEFTKFMEDDLFRSSLQVEPDVVVMDSLSSSPVPSTSARRMTMAALTSRATRGLVAGGGSPDVAPRGHSVPADLGAGRASASASGCGSPQSLGSKSTHSSHQVVPKSLGHRRAQSYDQKLLKEVIAPLSVIGTEARPGPRHLIDDSLLCGLSSTGSSAGDSGIEKTSMALVFADPVVGRDVLLSSDSGAESEGLLDSAESSEDDSLDVPKIQIHVDLHNASIAGKLKRKTRQRGVKKVKRWRKMYVALCDILLAFYRKVPKKKNKARAVPHQVINLSECEVAETVLQGKPNRFQFLHTVTNKIYTLKASSAEVAQGWLAQIQQALEPLRHRQLPALLMTFDDEDRSACSGSSDAS